MVIPEMERRRRATEATLNKFRGTTLDWREGRHCIRMAAFQLRGMGMKPPPVPRVRSALAAKKAIKARGWNSVTDMLDSMLERIPPAFMRLGDLAVVEGQQGLDAVVISAGARKFLGWHPETWEFVVWDDVEGLEAAWRIP